MTRVIIQTAPGDRRRAPWRDWSLVCVPSGMACVYGLDGRCSRCGEPRYVMPTTGVLPSAALAVVV